MQIVRAGKRNTMPANHTDLEKRLWDAADELRANSKLKSSEYSVPVLGLIFLRYADHKFGEAKARIASKGTGRRTVGKTDYQAQGVLYLPEAARFSTLLNLSVFISVSLVVGHGYSNSICRGVPRSICTLHRNSVDAAITKPEPIRPQFDRQVAGDQPVTIGIYRFVAGD